MEKSQIYSCGFFFYDIDKSEIISYDNKGNIIKRREYGFTLKDNTQIEEEKERSVKEYSYAGDEMKTCGGEICEYDVIGNPTTYRGKKATWTNGRFLNSYNNVSFSYDGLGRRIKKGNISYTYDSQGRLLKQSNGLEFLYDHSGVFAVKNGESTYFYRKDAQSNITAIIDSEGSVVARYLYNAWGEVSVVDNTGKEITDKENIANLNPYRYRSYYYDTETGLYYLKTRYYDPQVGRFMTIDGIEYLDPETINGLNLYAYCNNNPVMNVDPDGTWSWKAFWSIVLITLTAVLGVVATVATAGAATPLLEFGFSIIASTSFGIAASITDNLNQQVKQKGWDNVDFNEICNEGLKGAAVGALSGVFSFGFSKAWGVVGSQLGLEFARSALLGNNLTFGSVFGTSALEIIGYGGGKTLGKIVGVVVGDYLGSAALGNKYTLINKLGNLIVNEIPGLIFDFIRWALGS